MISEKFNISIDIIDNSGNWFSKELKEGSALEYKSSENKDPVEVNLNKQEGTDQKLEREH